MNLSEIYVIEKNPKKNLLSTFNSYLKDSVSKKSTGYTYMSKDVKFNSNECLDSIIIDDLLAQTLTSSHNKYIEKKLIEINCPEAFDIYDLLPDTKSQYCKLSEDQKFAFKILRMIIQNKKILILQEQDIKISSDLFLKTKNLFKNLALNQNYTIIIESKNFQNWSDICDVYIRFNSNKVLFIKNQLHKTDISENTGELYQLAL